MDEHIVVTRTEQQGQYIHVYNSIGYVKHYNDSLTIDESRVYHEGILTTRGCYLTLTVGVFYQQLRELP